MFTYSTYRIVTATKKGKATVKLIGEDYKWMVVTSTKVERFPKVAIPGRDSVHHTTNLVQRFHSEHAALAEYNRQRVSLEHHSWERYHRSNDRVKVSN
jgi:hypothetical protein